MGSVHVISKKLCSSHDEYTKRIKIGPVSAQYDWDQTASINLLHASRPNPGIESAPEVNPLLHMLPIGNMWFQLKLKNNSCNRGLWSFCSTASRPVETKSNASVYFIPSRGAPHLSYGSRQNRWIQLIQNNSAIHNKIFSAINAIETKMMHECMIHQDPSQLVKSAWSWCRVMPSMI